MRTQKSEFEISLFGLRTLGMYAPDFFSDASGGAKHAQPTPRRLSFPDTLTSHHVEAYLIRPESNGDYRELATQAGPTLTGFTGQPFSTQAAQPSLPPSPR